MAFKISKEEQGRIDAHVEQLKAQRSVLEDAVTKFNESQVVAFNVLSQALNEYNEMLSTAHGLVEDIHREHEVEFDEKSDAWKEGDVGTRVEAWIESLDELVNTLASEIEVQSPEDVDIEFLFETDPAEALENMDLKPE
jgi:hypothetical protein